ncbi:MAG TPA: hypothetical protein VN690_13940 [Terriglobales bacterium]|nr:hypothetical protein [Terriglobales bacterium]
MQEIAISKFKATCLSVIQDVRRTGKPVRITRFGHPMADLVPPGKGSAMGRVGALQGSVKALGDIVTPVVEDDGVEPGY